MWDRCESQHLLMYTVSEWERCCELTSAQVERFLTAPVINYLLQTMMKLLVVLLLGVYSAVASPFLRGQGEDGSPKQLTREQEKFKTFLEKTYEEHNPEKLKDIPKLMRYCRGEDSCGRSIVRVKNKYNLGPKEVRNYISRRWRYKLFLNETYAKHEPEKLEDDDALERMVRVCDPKDEEEDTHLDPAVCEVRWMMHVKEKFDLDDEKDVLPYLSGRERARYKRRVKYKAFLLDHFKKQGKTEKAKKINQFMRDCNRPGCEKRNMALIKKKWYPEEVQEKPRTRRL